MEPKVIYNVKVDTPTIIAVLLELHLWDLMSPQERQAVTERGEVWDTEPGRKFKQLVEAA